MSRPPADTKEKVSQKQIGRPAGFHPPVIFSLTPHDVAGKEMKFNNSTNYERFCRFCRRHAQLDAKIAWLLKSVSVSDRLENIYFTKWASVFCQKVASWQDLMQGKRRLWLHFFRLFYSIFGRHLPKLKRSESKTSLFRMAHSCKVAPLRHSPERCCFVSRRCS